MHLGYSRHLGQSGVLSSLVLPARRAGRPRTNSVLHKPSVHRPIVRRDEITDKKNAAFGHLGPYCLSANPLSGESSTSQIRLNPNRPTREE